MYMCVCVCVCVCVCALYRWFEVEAVLSVPSSCSFEVNRHHFITHSLNLSGAD